MKILNRTATLVALGSGDGTCRASTCLQGKLGWRGEREIQHERIFPWIFTAKACELLQGELWELYTSLGKGWVSLQETLSGRKDQTWWLPLLYSETVKQWQYSSYNDYFCSYYDKMVLTKTSIPFCQLWLDTSVTFKMVGSRICLRWRVWTLKASEQWKKPWLVGLYRWLYYPVI